MELKIITPLDILIERYNALVAEAVELDKEEPLLAMDKLRQAHEVQLQIEELKLAKNN